MRKKRKRNPLKYRMMDAPQSASRRSLVDDLGVFALLGMIGIGIYFAWSNGSSDSGT